MAWIVFGVLGLVLLIAYAACRRLLGWRRLPALLVAGAMGAALGAFLASAGSAMATAVDPSDAVARGAALGGLAGLGVGGIGVLMEAVWPGGPTGR